MDAADIHGTLTLLVDLPAFGTELWLDAFAQGAAALAIVDSAHLTPASRWLIGSRVTQAAVLLESLGMSGHRLGLCLDRSHGVGVKGRA